MAEGNAMKEKSTRSEKSARGYDVAYEVLQTSKNKMSRAMMQDLTVFNPCSGGNGGDVAVEGLTIWLAHLDKRIATLVQCITEGETRNIIRKSCTQIHMRDFW